VIKEDQMPSKKQVQEDGFQMAWGAACIAGAAAAEAKVPKPMYVVERANPMDDSSPIVKAYEPIADGVCGFAWVNVRPGNSPFANWLKKEGKARKAYGGGVQIWVSAYNQSLEKKEAYANAMEKALEALVPGVKFYADSRMD
jgi:hypothetical protein